MLGWYSMIERPQAYLAKVSICLATFAPFAHVSFAEPTFVLGGDTRLRYDLIDQDNLPDTGTALTLSARVSAEWTPTDWLFGLIEIEGVGALIDDFSDLPGPALTKPLIPDPDHLDINRFQIQADLGNGSFVTLGRQSLRIDDQRFLGMAPFRQNTRSYDGVRLSARTAGAHTLQAGYIAQVNRPLGNRTPLGEFESDSWFATVNLQTPAGRFGVFHYALDLETGPDLNRNRTLSSQTSGVRFDGRYHRSAFKFDIEASYARQTDYSDNPLSYEADYYLIDIRTFIANFEANLRHEVLGADAEQSFQTPLASLHKFQGEADVFLSTPINGIVDTSLGVKYNGGQIGPFKDVTPTVRVHEFEADQGGASHGHEVDFIMQAKLADLKLKVGLADYRADQFSSDRQRIFASITKRF
ncbi:MAG: alginate export family protein [Pseudomonadota bacterium]